MEKVTGQNKPKFGDPDVSKFANACVNLNDLIRDLTFYGYANDNNIIYRGLNPSGLPRLSLVDQCDTRILEKLTANS